MNTMRKTVIALVLFSLLLVAPALFAHTELGISERHLRSRLERLGLRL